MSVIFKHIESPIGAMIGGCTENGLCFLEWHDRGGVERILSRVEKRYKTDTIEGDHPHLKSLEAELADYFEGKNKNFLTSIDVKGTSFEMKVWDHLLKLPYGTTSTYHRIAKLMGSPTATRAVARSNGANYLSIIIPCHRVIGADGNLTGYGGKLWRKKYLLDLEAKHSGQWLSFKELFE